MKHWGLFKVLLLASLFNSTITMYGCSSCCCALVAYIKSWCGQRTPPPLSLIDAAQKGNLSALQKALKNGGAIDSQDAAGFTPLMHSIHNNHTQVALYLIASNADVNLGDANGATPLIVATKHANDTVIQKLLASKAHPAQANHNGTTALMQAAQQGNRTVVSKLIDAGSDVHARDSHGSTALMAADAHGQQSTAATLLHWGSNSHELDNAPKKSRDSLDYEIDPREPLKQPSSNPQAVPTHSAASSSLEDEASRKKSSPRSIHDVTSDNYGQ